MKYKSGLTTVELVVTLFIAAMFIISGYQLFNAVNLRSGNSREMVEASSIAYAILREKGEVYVPVSAPCTGTSIVEVATLETNNLPSPEARILRCKPYADGSGVRVTVEVEYGDGSLRRKVAHATYITP